MDINRFMNPFEEHVADRQTSEKRARIRRSSSASSTSSSSMLDIGFGTDDSEHVPVKTAAVIYDISIYDRLENDLTHDPPSGVNRRNKPPGQLNEEWLQQIIDCVTIQPEIGI